MPYFYLRNKPLISHVHLRQFKPEDAGALAAICNSRKIWLNVRDRFPHPYTVADAVEWIAYNKKKQPVETFVITHHRQVAGSIGVIPKDDIYRKSIEIGYFVGEDFQGKGIATQAVALLLEYIHKEFDVVRIWAEVFEHNTPSMKVLKKNGFHLESVRKKAVIKNGVIMDDYIWVKLVE